MSLLLCATHVHLQTTPLQSACHATQIQVAKTWSPPPLSLPQPYACTISTYVQCRRTSGLDEEAFGHVHNAIRRGDLVGVKGYPGKSKRGELSVFPTSFIVLAPCLHMLPKYRLDNQVSVALLHSPSFCSCTVLSVADDQLAPMLGLSLCYVMLRADYVAALIGACILVGL